MEYFDITFPIHMFKVETACTTLLSQLWIFLIKRIFLWSVM